MTHPPTGRTDRRRERPATTSADRSDQQSTANGAQTSSLTQPAATDDRSRRRAGGGGGSLEEAEGGRSREAGAGSREAAPGRKPRGFVAGKPVFLGQSGNLADQEEGGSAAMQGKESPVGSNTQETHQYVGPYRLEKTLGKGQTGASSPDLHFSRTPDAEAWASPEPDTLNYLERVTKRSNRPEYVPSSHELLSSPLFINTVHTRTPLSRLGHPRKSSFAE